MMSNRENCDIDWKTLKDTFTLAQETMGVEVSTPTILVTSCTLVPHYSRRVVIQPYRFMYLGEFFEAIPEEHEIDPRDYDEAMSSDDAIL